MLKSLIAFGSFVPHLNYQHSQLVQMFNCGWQQILRFLTVKVAKAPMVKRPHNEHWGGTDQQRSG